MQRTAGPWARRSVRCSRGWRSVLDLRATCARWPDIGTVRFAASWLHARRERFLEEQREWIAAQRRAKEAFRRVPAPAELRDMNARIRAYTASVPRVGSWGWRARRAKREDPLDA